MTKLCTSLCLDGFCPHGNTWSASACHMWVLCVWQACNHSVHCSLHVVMQQQQPYHPSPYGQPMPAHPAHSPSMMPGPYMINPQGMPYNTPPPAHMQMQFQGPLHPLAQSPGPVDHRTPHQNRLGQSPPLLQQHPSPAIPIPPPSARNRYIVGPGSQGPMGQ